MEPPEQLFENMNSRKLHSETPKSFIELQKVQFSSLSGPQGHSFKVAQVIQMHGQVWGHCFVNCFRTVT